MIERYISNLLSMLPETLIAFRGITVVSTEPENSLGKAIDKGKNNFVPNVGTVDAKNYGCKRNKEAVRKC